MKVLHIGKYYYPYIGGTESYLFTLAEELKKELEIEIIAINTKFKTSVENHNGINIYRLGCFLNFFSLPLTLSLPFWLKKRKADILHFHFPNPWSILAYYLCRPKGKIVVSYHSDIIKQRFFNPLLKPFLIKFLEKADEIIVSSQNLVKNSFILKRFKDKCRIIPYGIDINRFSLNDNTIEKVRAIKEKYDGQLILFVGRLVYYKGLEYLLRAMREIPARLIIAGEGPLKGRLMRLAKCLGVWDKVIWAGKIRDEDLPSFYHACDVFVLPSSIRAESFGIVQLEAFACGKPVVSADLPTGVTFVNVNGKTGFIVPPRDPCALAGAVNKLLGSSHLRDCYGENGRERVAKEFSKEKMASEVLNLYRSIYTK